MRRNRRRVASRLFPLYFCKRLVNSRDATHRRSAELLSILATQPKMPAVRGQVFADQIAEMIMVFDVLMRAVLHQPRALAKTFIQSSCDRGFDAALD